MIKMKSIFGVLSVILLFSCFFQFHFAKATTVDLNEDIKLQAQDIKVKLPDYKIFLFPSSNGVKRWDFATGDIVSSPAIGSDGTIYVGSKDGKLYAIDQKGKKKWEIVLDVGYNNLPVIGSDGIIYVGSASGRLYAIHSDGTEKWKFETDGNVYSSPAFGADGTIYIGSRDKKLYAIKPNGTKKWEFTTQGAVTSSPKVSSDGTIYIGSHDKKLYAIKPNGTKKWEFATDGEVEASPAIDADGTIYIGSHDKKLYAIKSDGTKKWEFVTGKKVGSSAAIGTDGTIYFGSDDNKLYAIKPDGTKKWEFATGHWVSSSPAIGLDGTIYVGSWDFKLYAIKPNGTKKWEFATGWWISSSPAIGPDGAVYIGSQDKHLYAIGMVSVSEVSLNKTNITLESGQSEMLIAKVNPSDATFQDIEWSSDDDSIATVDDTGKVTGINQGVTTITATAEDGGYFKQCVVTVTEANDKPTPGNVPEPEKTTALEISLSDIDGHWAKDNIIQGVSKGIVLGYPDGTFKPDGSVTRAELAVMLMKALMPSIKGTELTFKDKEKIGSWSAKEIAQCVELGIINGYPDGTFGPGKTISHAEMITMIVRAGNLPTADDAVTGYLDNAAIPEYARSKVAAAELYGILNYIVDNKFNSNKPSTRAESITAILNMLKVKK